MDSAVDEKKEGIANPSEALIAILDAARKSLSNGSHLAGEVGHSSERIYNVHEAGELLRYKSSYVYEFVERGELDAIRHGKYITIRESAIRAFEATYLAKTITTVVSALQSISSQAGNSLNRARRGDLDARLAYGRDSTPNPQPGSAAIAPLAPVHRDSPLVTTTIRNGQTKADARPTTRI